MRCPQKYEKNISHKRVYEANAHTHTRIHVCMHVCKTRIHTRKPISQYTYKVYANTQCLLHYSHTYVCDKNTNAPQDLMPCTHVETLHHVIPHVCDHAEAATDRPHDRHPQSVVVAACPRRQRADLDTVDVSHLCVYRDGASERVGVVYMGSYMIWGYA